MYLSTSKGKLDYLSSTISTLGLKSLNIFYPKDEE
jgi:hypothetical protein